jgi:hypothetical protein
MNGTWWRRKRLLPNVSYYSGICLGETEENHKTSQNSQFLSRDLSPEPPKYEAGLPTRLFFHPSLAPVFPCHYFCACLWSSQANYHKSHKWQVTACDAWSRFVTRDGRVATIVAADGRTGEQVAISNRLMQLVAWTRNNYSRPTARFRLFLKHVDELSVSRSCFIGLFYT